MMTKLLLIGGGGFLGSVFRYLLSSLVHKVFSVSFPAGTLAVNLTGCLLIGLLGGLANSRELFSPELRMFLFIGLLGGFTTFSSFGYETHMMIRDQEYLKVILNISAQVIIGLFLCFAGYKISELL